MATELDDKTRIETDFQEYIIKCRASSGSIDQRRDRDRYLGYLAGATKERERAKELVEALEKVILEDELGIVQTSGKYLANIAKQALDNYKK